MSTRGVSPLKKFMIWIPAFLCLVILIGLRFVRPGIPENIGIKDGNLTDCPTSPNCVSSQAQSESHRVEPLKFTSNPEETRNRLRSLLAKERGWKFITESPTYWHLEFRTRWMGYVDDVELLFEDDQGMIHVRSASRLGRQLNLVFSPPQLRE